MSSSFDFSINRFIPLDDSQHANTGFEQIILKCSELDSKLKNMRTKIKEKHRKKYFE